jgi:nucleoside-diphosphate-sugar epimerase
MKNLLLVGGSGFFGKSLIDYLSQNQIKKKFLNIYILSKKKKIKKKNINNLCVKSLNEDLLKIKKIPKVNYIIYLAKLNNSKQDIKAAKNFIEILKEKNLKEKIYLLYVSSGAVYGEIGKKKLIGENYFSKIKRKKYSNFKKEDYAQSKIKCENFFLNSKIKYLDVRIARCFTFTGEYLDDNKFAIVEFINSIINKKKIILKSNYQVYRSYMHSKEMSEWLINILLKKNMRQNIFNVGSEDKIELNELAKILALKFNLKLIQKKKIKKKVNFYVPSVNRYKRIFKFKKKQSSLRAILATIKKINHAKTY